MEALFLSFFLHLLSLPGPFEILWSLETCSIAPPLLLDNEKAGQSSICKSPADSESLEKQSSLSKPKKNNFVGKHLDSNKQRRKDEPLKT